MLCKMSPPRMLLFFLALATATILLDQDLPQTRLQFYSDPDADLFNPECHRESLPLTSIDKEDLPTHPEVIELLHQCNLDYIGNGIKCVTTKQEYWDYSFCLNGTISQFHTVDGSFDKTVPVYVLGDMSGQLANGAITQVPSSSQEYDVVALKVLDNGSICDISGNPRTLLVNYKCPSTDRDERVQPPYIESVAEFRSCQYQINVVLPSLCRLGKIKTLQQSKKSFAQEVLTCANAGGNINVEDFKLSPLGGGLFLLRHLGEKPSMVITTEYDQKTFDGQDPLLFKLAKGFHYMVSQVTGFEPGLSHELQLYDPFGQFLSVVQLSVLDGKLLASFK